MGELINVEIDILEEMEPSINVKKLGKSNFLVPFFNLFYYFLLVPFKIQLNPDNNLYFLKSCILNKVLCGLTHAIVFVTFSFMILVTIIFGARNSEPAIVLVFDLTSNISALVAYAIIINLLWRRQDGFLRVIERTRLQEDMVSIAKGKVVIGFVFHAFLFVLFASLGIVNWITISEESHWNVVYALSHGTVNTVKLNKLNVTCSESRKENEWSKERTKLLLLNGIIFVLYLYTSVFYVTIQGTLLTLAMTLRKLGNQFSVQISKSHSVDKGIMYYRELKETCEEIRRVYGNHLMAYYIVSVSYYAEAPHVLLGKRGEMERVIFIYFFISGVVWILAAEFHHHVRKIIQKWIRFHTDSSCKVVTIEDRLKLLTISNEVSSDPVALSSKYFKVTYGHIGSMIGFILTYGIIVCQLYHNKDST